VTTKKVQLDKSFIERQRKRLLKLRDSLAGATAAKRAEEDSENEQASGDAVEYEDDAQRLATLELDGNLVARNAQRLAQVDRALAKIAEGTYGRSDASDAPIPVERLEAIPEAIHTLAEQKALEARR
jgi:DnaK suppressor protein